jgi:hypothetical protein
MTPSPDPRDAVDHLRAWFDRNGWSGWDPYDVRGTRPFLALQRTAAGRPRALRVPLRAASELVQLAPRWARRALRVRPSVNPHGMALLASAYWTLGDEDARARGRSCLEWLAANGGGGAWGYPFDWQSLTFIPRGTPSGFVSILAADAFWRAYEHEGNPGDLDVCSAVCEFIAGDLNRTETSAGLCFSYTPVDTFQVHNTNLLAAELLDRVGRETGRDDWLDLAGRAAAFTLAEQRADGAIEYWAHAQPGRARNAVDHYHTGNSLRALHGLWRRTGDDRYRAARDRLLAFAAGHLWHGARPQMYADRLYPVDIHACAEAILSNVTLSDELPDAYARAGLAAQWTLDRMRRADGAFGHLLVRRLGRDILTGIPYVRWSQAPMFLALAAYVGRKA